MDWSNPPESFFENGPITVLGCHKTSNTLVDIKIYSKKDMLMHEVEDLRHQISMF
jgi:hypothetical protein